MELRGDKYRLTDHGPEQLIPRNVTTQEESFQNQASCFLVPRKPVSHLQSSVITSTKKGPSKQIYSVYLAQQLGATK